MCWFHGWTKWMKIEGRLVLAGHVQYFPVKVNLRVCNKCGKSQLKGI